MLTLAASTASLYGAAREADVPTTSRHRGELVMPSGLALAPLRERALIVADGPILRKIDWRNQVLKGADQEPDSTAAAAAVAESTSSFADRLLQKWSRGSTSVSGL